MKIILLPLLLLSSLPTLQAPLISSTFRAKAYLFVDMKGGSNDFFSSCLIVPGLDMLIEIQPSWQYSYRSTQLLYSQPNWKKWVFHKLSPAPKAGRWAACDAQRSRQPLQEEQCATDHSRPLKFPSAAIPLSPKDSHQGSQEILSPLWLSLINVPWAFCRLLSWDS